MVKISTQPPEAERLDYIQFIFIDLFCGAGGTTIGAEKTESLPADLVNFLRANNISLPKDKLKETFFKICKVVACVNHDPIAIKSHWSNHPEVTHYEEDIRLLNPFGHLKRLIDYYRLFYPHAKIVLWASLECTNFSKAKGGESRDQDSRTLALELYRYIIALNPDYILIENVVEFMAWGPMIIRMGKTPEGWPFSHLKIQKYKKPSKKLPDGQPLKILPSYVPESSKNGKDWLQWRQTVNSLGYHDEWKQINAADHGAMTSRNRLFGCFARVGTPIVWPLPSHSKNPDKTSMVTPMKKWNAVKHALDFNDEGISIFNRYKRLPKIITTKHGHQACRLSKKYDEKYKTFGPVFDPLSTATMQRIFMGSVKHIAGGKDNFVSRYYGGDAEHRNHSVEEPAGTITTRNVLSLIKTNRFITKDYSGRPEQKNASIEDPSQTITTFGAGRLVKIDTFIDKAFGGKPEHKSSSIDNPLSTITTIPNQNRIIKATFIDQRNGKGEDRSKSTEEPAKTLTATGGNQQIVFLHNYNGVNGGKHDNSFSIEAPTGALRCGDGHAKISAFLSPFNSNKTKEDGGGNEGKSIEEPSPTIATQHTPAFVTCEHFIQKYYSSGGQHNSIHEPASTLTVKDRLNKVTAIPFKDDGQHQSIENPAGTIMTNDKHNLVTADKWIMATHRPGDESHPHSHSLENPSPTLTASRHHHYLVNPLWFNTAAGSIEEPCWVIVARQDKAPLGLITMKTGGPIAIPIYEDDCEWTVKLKEFMVLYNIIDIKMRMLKVMELKKIQGFPEDYYLGGNQGHQKKFIGNSVCPVIPKRWMRAFSNRLLEYKPEALRFDFEAKAA